MKLQACLKKPSFNCNRLQYYTKLIHISHPTEASSTIVSLHPEQKRFLTAHRPPPKKPARKWTGPAKSHPTRSREISNELSAQSYDLDSFQEFQKSPIAPCPEASPETLLATWQAFCYAVKGVSRYEAMNTLPLDAVKNVSAQNLHQLALTISRMNRRDPSDFTFGIMFGIAGRANFEPSYLSLAFIAAGAKDTGAEQLASLPWLKAKLEHSINSGNPNALAIQAKFSFNTGRVEEAAAIFEQLLETTDEAVKMGGHGNADAAPFETDKVVSWLAQCYFALGKNDKAIAVVANRNVQPEVAAQVAEAQFEAGNLAAARENLYNNGNPQGISAYEKLGLIESKLAETANTEAEKNEYWRWAKEWNIMGKTIELLVKKHGQKQNLR